MGIGRLALASPRWMKPYAYPRLHEQHITVDVADLTRTERQQILYNHLAAGDQPQDVRARMKPHLEAAADAAPLPRILWLYPGNDSNGLGTRSQIGSSWNAYTFAGIGDFNGDGNPDVIARDDATGILWLYPRTATAFSTRQQIGTGW
ncbi:VCBS repeat-containing protein [Streptomyces sp. NPDC046900]|uniref:FG-GAP repeat domain-containing protein n=1 Tax=Streptomyces sp. NPDC046900 TaxID=3155473 RepID=UPI0033D0068C